MKQNEIEKIGAVSIFKGGWAFGKNYTLTVEKSDCLNNTTEDFIRCNERDLKDLRTLIDTVLGEECPHKKSALSKSTRWGTRKICNSYGDKVKKV